MEKIKNFEEAGIKIRKRIIDDIVKFLKERKTEFQKILSDMTRNSYDKKREIGIMAKIEEIMQEIKFIEKLK